MEDSLIISYDNCSSDVPTLIVAKKYRQDFTMLNKIQGDAAFGIYHYLTGGADFVSARDTPKKVVEVGKYGFCCPNCKEDFGLEKEDICIYEMTPPIYCEHCGQKLDWSDWE